MWLYQFFESTINTKEIVKKQTRLTRIVRKSRGLKKKIEECSRIMKSVDKFVQGTAAQIASYERQISLLMTENSVLRKALKMSSRKNPPVTSFPFIMPELTDSPSSVLDRRIEEILPLTDNMNGVMRGARTRIIKVFKSREWQTVGDLLRANEKIKGPKWDHMLWFRNIGRLSLSIFRASFNHFKVDRKNLPAQPLPPAA